MRRKLLVAAAVLFLGLPAVLTGVWANPAWRGRLYDGMLGLLRAWDGLYLGLQPHLEFTRPAEPKDKRPLSAQAAEMEKDLDAVFTVEDGELFIISTPPVPVGDVCLWQGVFAGEAALRWHLDPTERNLRRAAKALKGLERLTTRGRPLARSVYPVGLQTEDPGRWAGRNDRWQWKEDASVDSASGWIFGAVLLRELVGPLSRDADEAILRFTRSLEDSEYLLRNSDGTPTRYGTMGGAFVNSPVGILVTMAALRAAAEAEPDGPWADRHAGFVAQGRDRWGAYTSGPVLWLNKSTNHNIAFLALTAALLTEDAPDRKTVYARGLVRLSELTRRSGDSFWIYLSHWALARAGMGDPKQDAEVAAYVARRGADMRLAEISMLEWDYPKCKLIGETVNSTRSDLKTRAWPLGGKRVLLQPLPVWQRPPADFVWQRSAYSLDDWVGYDREPPQRFSPLDFLAAYRLRQALQAGGPEASAPERSPDARQTFSF